MKTPRDVAVLVTRTTHTDVCSGVPRSRAGDRVRYAVLTDIFTRHLSALKERLLDCVDVLDFVSQYQRCEAFPHASGKSALRSDQSDMVPNVKPTPYASLHMFQKSLTSVV